MKNSTRGTIPTIGFVVLAAAAYFLNGNDDADVWAWAFWISALTNFVLLVLLDDQRARRRKSDW